MPDYPKAIWDYVCLRALGRQQPAYLLLDGDGRIQEWGGCLDLFRQLSFSKGEVVSDIFEFMHGILPLETDELFLPDLSIHSTDSTDAHIFKTAGGYGLLLVTSALDNEGREKRQQFFNATMLSKTTRFANIVSGNAGKCDPADKNAVHWVEGEKELDITRIFVTVLAAEIRIASDAFTSETDAAYSNTLIPYLTLLANAMSENNGFLETLLGNRMLSLFGISPIRRNPASEALSAAVQIMEASISESPALNNTNMCFPCRMGVASGEAFIGYSRIEDKRFFHCHGECIETAQLLARQAKEGLILIDETTYRLADIHPEKIFPVRNPLDGSPGSSVFYQWEKEN